MGANGRKARFVVSRTLTQPGMKPRWFWLYYAANGACLAVSAGDFQSKGDAKKSATKMRKDLSQAEIHD